MKLFIKLLFLCVFTNVFAADNITIYTPYSSTHSGNVVMYEIINNANASQNEFNFILELKPGAEQLLAIKAMDDRPNHSLSIIAPKYVEHVKSNKISKSDYIPVSTIGDTCWAVITNKKQLKSVNELVVGGVGFGNAAHLTSLLMGEKYGFKVRYVPFKSNFDALMLVVGDGSVNMVLERANNYIQYKDKNSNLHLFAMSCPKRSKLVPTVPTLREMGIDAPYVFNTIIANNKMSEDIRKRIQHILDNAINQIGKDKIEEISDFVIPTVSVEQHYNVSFDKIDKLLNHFMTEIKQ